MEAKTFRLLYFQLRDVCGAQLRGKTGHRGNSSGAHWGNWSPLLSVHSRGIAGEGGGGGGGAKRMESIQRGGVGGGGSREGRRRE